MFAVVAALLFTNCSSGSSGSKMLDLDVRIIPLPDEDRFLNHPKEKQFYENYSNLFIVLPGPYEFTWEELKNQDGAVGYEQCSTKLKVRLRRSNLVIKSNNSSEYLDDEMRIERIIDSYSFKMFNSEGKTTLDLDPGSSDGSILLYLKPELVNLWGSDGKIGFKKNEDGIRDFYHFLMSEPGTEYDLILDCGIHSCKKIEDIIEFNKGLNIYIDARYNLELSKSFFVK
jgi:hypothetical protein